MPRRFVALLNFLALAVLCGSGCVRVAPVATPEPVLPPTPEVTAEPPLPTEEERAEHARVLADLDRCEKEYRGGIDLLASGDEVSGERMIGEASECLVAGARRCLELLPCDATGFMDSFTRLLDAQSLALKKQSFEMGALLEEVLEPSEEEVAGSAFSEGLPEVSRTLSLLRGTDIRELIELNAPIHAALDDWLTWLRPQLMTSYENYAYVRDQIAGPYEEAGFPEALAFAIVATESGGKVHARSRAGAAGLFQFMALTGRRFGLHVEDGFDLRFDPAASARANIGYINERLSEFNNNLEWVLAAYNGGETRARGLRNRMGERSVWDRQVYYSFPRETRDYVPRVLAAAWLFLHPADYNLSFPSINATKTELSLDREFSLGELTICLGQEGNPDGWFRTLRNLNPRIRADERVPAGTTLVVPVGLEEIYRENCFDADLLDRAATLFAANYPDDPEWIPYTVRRGDTLGRIASRLRCVSVAELADVNRIRAPRYTIRVGQQLRVPTCR